MQSERPVQAVVSTLRATSSVVALVALIAFNLVPLMGVIVWGWSMMLILILYWLENGVIGVINIFKIATAQGTMPLGPATAGTARSASVRRWPGR